MNFKGSSIFSRRRWWTWWRRNWNWWTQRTRSLFAHCKCSQNYEKSHSYPSNFKLFLFGIFFELVLWNFSKKNKNNIFCREKLPKMRANVSKNVFQSLFHLSHQKPQTDVRYLNVFFSKTDFCFFLKNFFLPRLKKEKQLTVKIFYLPCQL